MSSLYKRANLRQGMVLRIVAGAVKNARDAHKDWPLDDRFPRSIAKRVVGTLTAAMPKVLATPAWVSSESPETLILDQSRGRPENAGLRRSKVRARAAVFTTRAHLESLHREIGNMVSVERRGGDIMRYKALIDVLRVIRNRIDDLKTS